MIEPPDPMAEPTPDEGLPAVGPPEGVQAEAVTLEQVRAALRNAIEKKATDLSTAQTPDAAEQWAQACERAAHALQMVDPSLQPKAKMDSRTGAGDEQAAKRPKGASS